MTVDKFFRGRKTSEKEHGKPGEEILIMGTELKTEKQNHGLCRNLNN